MRKESRQIINCKQLGKHCLGTADFGNVKACTLVVLLLTTAPFEIHRTSLWHLSSSSGLCFSTVPLASLALGHVTASSLLVTCAGRLKSLCWVSHSLCIYYFFLSRVENVRWGEINVLSHSFWFKISLSIEPLSTGLLKRIIYSSHWAKMSPLALIEIKEQFCLKRIPFLTLLSLETFVCNFCNLKQISSI